MIYLYGKDMEVFDTHIGGRAAAYPLFIYVGGVVGNWTQVQWIIKPIVDTLPPQTFIIHPLKKYPPYSPKLKGISKNISFYYVL